ncbi:MAG: TonB-dependent receptor, partial [Deltaproteobacteria bacterium]|nr:TonB-dependent receptor [Deltaproteobacteria bacterium]
LKATVTHNQRDFFTLPSSFTASLPNEDGGRRNNSDSKNQAVNLLAGWTPTEDVDVMFGFVRQSMERGQPPNAAQHSYPNLVNLPPFGPNAPREGGADQLGRYWRWPEYETTRYYINANINLTEQAHLKAVVYNDEHKDTTWDYSRFSDALPGDPTFTNRRVGGQSYDQFTRGGQVTLGYTFNEANKLAVSAGYRRLSHKATREVDFVDNWVFDAHIVEDYWDFGGEYTLKPLDPLTLVFGASSSHLIPKTIQDNLTAPNPAQRYFGEEQDGSKNLFNYQVGAFYELSENHELFATFAKKSRFGTMRERFYNRGGQPRNPDLKPEHAFHYELGYRGLIQDWMKINSSIFYSDVKEMIYMISANEGFDNSQRTKFHGFELGAEALFNQYLTAGLTFNYLEWNNTSKDPRYSNLTQLPKVTSTIYAVVSPLEGLSIIPQVNISSGFYWTSDPTVTSYKESGGFATADLKAVYDFNEHLTFEVGAKNLFDREYAYSAYYPEPGRSFFVGLTGRY